MFWNLVKSLRPLAIVAIVVAWNALCLIGVWLNGGMGRVSTFGSAAVMTIACLSLAIFAFSAAQTGAVQRAVLRPNANPTVARPGLFFLGLMGVLLALGSAFTAYGLLNGHT